MEKKKEQLVTERLVLKAFRECDRPAMIDMFCNETIKKTYMLPDFENKEQAGALFDKFVILSRADDRFLYGVFLDDTPIGFINDCEKNDSMMELGYVITPEYQGKGFATEAVQACIRELFRMGYEHVRAGYFEGNTASRRVMEKCGMHKLPLEEDIEYKGALRHCLYFGIDKC